MIKKILIANRGEIALRIMKTARSMGIKTVAIFSKIDRDAAHVLFADESVCIGPAPSNESYLKGDEIIEIARELNVDAIHPGYGFLSENADFAEKVEAAGLKFIGPKSHAIRVMGSKLAAKETVKAYDIPMVPGTNEAITDISEAKQIAAEIGFPILIKASAGGGGKGMRIVEHENEFEQQMKRAISEAENAFGDGSVFIEKFVTSPRHIEIQVLADAHGNVVHLFERECSIQRRHQKVVEEAPSAVLTPEKRNLMGAAAVNVAKSCDYVGAGTVEFLLDENHNFYFLEMNTRLQVEHPVTELITGLDLVELQIRIANGELLPFTQEELKIKGHAFELRVYAEDPADNFMPSVGILKRYQPPKGEHIRVDDGYREDMEVPIQYDPMLSKLIVYGDTRAEAIQHMVDAISKYQVEGVKTTLDFGQFVFEHPAFQEGNFDTNFVTNHYLDDRRKTMDEEEARVAALFSLKHYLTQFDKLRIPK